MQHGNPPGKTCEVSHIASSRLDGPTSNHLKLSGADSGTGRGLGMSRKNVVLKAIAEVLGRKSSAYTDLASAIDNNDNLSLILCQQTLESLPVETKTALWSRVRDLEDAMAKGLVEEDDADETRSTA